MVHRSFANQLSDYQFIVEVARRQNRQTKNALNSKSRRASGDGKLRDVARYILDQKAEGLSYFALHKMCFLAEVAHMEETSERLTNAYVIRQKDGPYYVDLHVVKLTSLVPGLVVNRGKGGIHIQLMPQRSFDDAGDSLGLSPAEVRSIDRALERYGALSDMELKRVAYLTRPMRVLLRKEKKLQMNLFNSAILPYKAKNSQKQSS